MWCVSLYVQGYDGIWNGWIDGWNGSMDDQSKKIQDGNKTEKEKEKREQNGNHVVVRARTTRSRHHEEAGGLM